ncbi:MAG: transporter substrate-binding domain-containing protein, partial [Alphaproteobacteria bacterium]
MKYTSMGTMRAVVVSALAALLSVGAAVAQSGSSLQKILSSGTLRVGTTGDYNPMTIFDPNTNSYRGYEIEAAQKLAEDLGVKLEFVRTDWKSLIQGLASDKYDILMSGTSLSVGRLKIVSFSQPYNNYFMVGLALKDKADKFKTWDDVNKKDVKVAVTLGTNFEGIAKEVLPQST